LTLGLDKRYEVIAYSIAYGSLESGKSRVDGFYGFYVFEAIDLMEKSQVGSQK